MGHWAGLSHLLVKYWASRWSLPVFECWLLQQATLYPCLQCFFLAPPTILHRPFHMIIALFRHVAHLLCNYWCLYAEQWPTLTPTNLLIAKMKAILALLSPVRSHWNVHSTTYAHILGGKITLSQEEHKQSTCFDRFCNENSSFVVKYLVINVASNQAENGQAIPYRNEQYASTQDFKGK